MQLGQLLVRLLELLLLLLQVEVVFEVGAGVELEEQFQR